jgi:orotidine-5'-phosphate decarboxylase
LSGETPGFGDRLLDVFRTSGHLCVGIDPHPYLLERWGLPDTGDGLREFGLRVVEAAAGRVGILKPQVAFFERLGSAGFAALEDVLAAARASGTLIIADAKRGDIGSTVAAYGEAWLRPGSPLEADALTVNAFQGVGALDEPWQLARESGKGLFVLAATSNPQALAAQTAVQNRGELAGRTIAASIVDEVNRGNSGELGSFGVVIGATTRLADYGISVADLESTPILGPGFGHQGATYDAIPGVYGTAASGLVVSSSREILEAGPAGLVNAIDSQVRDLAAVYAA